MAIHGYDLKTCDCEDFPCCGHNDVDPNWEPDPYDEPINFGGWSDDDVTMCSQCDGDAAVTEGGEPLCADCLSDLRRELRAEGVDA